MVQAIGAGSPLTWGSPSGYEKEILGTDACSLATYESYLMCGDTLVEDEQTIQIQLHMHEPFPNGYGISPQSRISEASVVIYGHDLPASECEPITGVDTRGVRRIFYCDNKEKFENPRGFSIKIEAIESKDRSTTTLFDMLLPPGIDAHVEPRIEIHGGDVHVIFYKKGT